MNKSLISCFLLIFFINIFLASNPAGVSDSLRNYLFDAYQRLPQNELSDTNNVLIVNIDEKSLSSIGQWPWSRVEIARLIMELANSGASSILVDFIFSEEDRTSPNKILKTWSLYTDTSQISELIKKIPDPDLVLSNVILQSNNVTTSFAVTSDNNKNSPLKKSGLVIIGQNPKASLSKFTGSILSLKPIEKSSKGIGGVTLDQTKDGVIRRIPLFLNINSNIYPSNISEAIRIYNGADTYQVKSNTLSNSKNNGNTYFDSVRIGNLNIPTNKNAEIWLRSRLNKNYKIISAIDLLDKKIQIQDIQNKIIIIGTNAEGLALTKVNSLSEKVSGTEIYASAISQIISKDFLNRPDWFFGAELVISIIFSIVFLIILFFASPTIGAIISIISISLTLYSGYYFFLYKNLLFDVAPLFISLLTIYILFITTQFSSNYAQKKQIRNTFERYLSPTVIQQLSKNPQLIQLGGEVRQLTVLFCDIRKFTNISEQYANDPEGLVSLLNRFLTPLTSSILNNSGTVDKYMGDCIMAFWNAPLDVYNHEIKACIAAKEMHKKIKELNEELIIENKLPIEAGIGINSGIGLVGNVGSTQRFDYSVIGDTVNLAARLESQSKIYGFPTLVSEFVAKNDTSNSFIEIDKIRVKGKNNPVKIFILKDDISNDPNDAIFNEIDNFLKNYRLQKWNESKINLLKIHEESPICKVYCEEFLKRINYYNDVSMDKNWDGVYVATTK